MGVEELYIYIAKSETHAKLDATKLFYCITKQQGYRDIDFDGPKNMQYIGNVYGFEWSLRGAKDSTVTILVSYLPYDLDYSFSKDLSFWKGKPTSSFNCQYSNNLWGR